MTIRQTDKIDSQITGGHRDTFTSKNNHEGAVESKNEYKHHRSSLTD